jgi:hypothetical protein
MWWQMVRMILEQFPTKIDPYLGNARTSTSSKGHYSWIKNFSRFCGKFKTHGKCHTHYCKHCLQGYTSEKLLGNHLSMGCAEITTCKPCMPKEEDAFVEFKNTEIQIKAPFVICSDLSV